MAKTMLQWKMERKKKRRGRAKCKSRWLKKEIPKLRMVTIFILERVWWIEREIGSGRRRRRRTDLTVLGERKAKATP